VDGHQKLIDGVFMNWIKSVGGPLICVERELAPLWLGIVGNGVSDRFVTPLASDYDRACAVSDYVGSVDLPRGKALILGDMPLETTVWRPQSALPLIIRAFYMEPGVNLQKLLTAHSNLDFADPIESIDCEVESGHMVIFDSAVPWLQEGGPSLSLEIPSGNYQILTKVFELDSQTSVLIHKFERVESVHDLR
jgi:Immunity protein 21